MKIFKKEQEVAELAHEYLDVSADCVTEAEQAVAAYLGGDLAAARDLRNRVRKLEAKADELERAIADKLHSGAYLPLVRGDIYTLIEMFDRVPNAAEACATFFLSEKPAIPEEFAPIFRKLLANSFGAVKPLGEAVKTFFKPKGKTEEVRTLTADVSIQESLADDIEWELTNSIFDSSLDLASKLHLRKAVERIVHISDRAEDTGDHLGLVAVKTVA
ncbi:MAG: DUF47 domain-containing protein [Akkermansiaceae bacterium]|nr:DUF47 domain-containing protein [Akkermansiaceae bacterium]NNM28230.1 DUF47 domain-containing protein [Akkermansiaceae bacterium]